MGKIMELRTWIVNIRRKRKVGRRNLPVAGAADVARAGGKGVEKDVEKGVGKDQSKVPSMLLRPRQVGVLPRQKVQKNRHQKQVPARNSQLKSPQKKR